MYKLAIIDDETEQVRGIRDFIDWSRYDIEVCGVAYNGREGLSLIEESTPDIAIIDIQMPHMDGLTLIEKINDTGRDVQMIILSGHDNFEYARKAIHLKANNYLLKPCTVEEILQAVLRAKNLAADEQNKKETLRAYHTLFQEHKVFLKDKLLTDLLRERLRNASTFFHDAVQYGIDLTPGPCCAAVFRLLDIDEIYARNTNEEFDYLALSVASFIRDQAKAMAHSELAIHEDDMVLIATDMEHSDFVSSIEGIHHALSGAFAYGFAVGIGRQVASPLSASVSYHQALAALDNSIFIGSDSVIVYDNQMLEENYQHFYPFGEEDKIFSAVEMGSPKIRVLVDNFFRAFDSAQGCDCAFIKKIGITLLSNIYKHCADRNIDSPEIDALIYRNFDRVNTAKTLDALKTIIADVLNDIIELITQHNQMSQLIQTAVEYIHTHYAENINLKTVADTLFITPAYLSVLFKQETQENFIDYLNNHRIERAKELLKDIRLKNYEVAYRIGFQDEKYFYKLFKKHTGLTPSQYRDSLAPAKTQ